MATRPVAVAWVRMEATAGVKAVGVAARRVAFGVLPPAAARPVAAAWAKVETKAGGKVVRFVAWRAAFAASSVAAACGMVGFCRLVLLRPAPPRR
eukprot:1067507-Pleurochrysis_carterae.AAC.2